MHSTVATDLTGKPCTTVLFIDTNVLLYAVGRRQIESGKRSKARSILADEAFGLSVQVLQEFYVQATRSTRPDPLTHRQAADLVLLWSQFPIQPMTIELVASAMETAARFQISYWDAAIIEAARLLGCSEVLSEDLSHGQDYDGVRVTNPFRETG